MRIDLVCAQADCGAGANDGLYYPVGLLSIASHVTRTVSGIDVRIVDEHHSGPYCDAADIVGISASSTLNYGSVLRAAEQAKASGAYVVLGGPHASRLPDQIISNHRDIIDCVIRGPGERSFAGVVRSRLAGRGVGCVAGVSWRRDDGTAVHNAADDEHWRYEDCLPFDFSLLSEGVQPYWARLEPQWDAAIVTFTHLGCAYKQGASSRAARRDAVASWCSYCSLGDHYAVRAGTSIVTDICDTLVRLHVPSGSRVLLKCYGDNAACHPQMLADLGEAMEQSDAWNEYRLRWVFYAQSSLLSARVAALLHQLGTQSVFIGFDSADDRVQRLNALGTTYATHRRAVSLCAQYGISIQAGFVVGCAGDTEDSLARTLAFAAQLRSSGVLDRVNAAMMVIMPGAPNYELLCAKEPWIRSLDYLPTEQLRWYWVKHFCPHLGCNPTHGVEILRRIANQLDELSPGAHASMGFTSNLLARQEHLVERPQ